VLLPTDASLSGTQWKIDIRFICPCFTLSLFLSQGQSQIMADPLPPDEPYLSAYMRVQRGVETAQDHINAFPALEQAALNPSSAGGGAVPGLTEQDRRRLLDLPDAEEEAANIRHVSARSRAELVSAALSRPGDLSDAELKLLMGRFWADVTPQETETSF
jgi:hypothetical protein